MEADFWLDRWQKNEIGFHLSEANPALVKHLPALDPEKGDRIFLPLCGKTLDIGWLLAQGYHVAGAELSELAIQQLFDELGVAPDVTNVGSLKRYSAPGIDIFVGDIFDLTTDILGPVDRVYDRAALVALPDAMRRKYAAHMRVLTREVDQLLITFEYDQSKMPGPPFSVPAEEVRALYAGHYEIDLLSTEDIPGGIKGITAASQQAWLLI